MASKQTRQKSVKKTPSRVTQPASAKPFAVAWRTAVAGGVLFAVIVLLAAVLWPLPDELNELGGSELDVRERQANERGGSELRASALGVAEAEQRLAAVESAKRWVAEVSLPEPLEIEFDAVQSELRKSVEELLVSYPDDFKTQHLAGLVYSQLKQSTAAESAFRKSLKLNGRDVQVRIDLAKELMQTGRDEDALEVLLAADTKSVNEGASEKSGALSLLKAELLTRLGQLEEAIETLKAALKLDSRLAAHWLELGKLQMQIGERQMAGESVRKSIELDRDNEQAWLALCQVLSAQRATDELAVAKQEYEKLRAKSRERQRVFEEVHLQSLRRFAVSSYRSLALLYFEHQQAALSLRWFKRALELEPRDLPTLNALMAFYRRSGQLESAIELGRQVLVAGPSDYVNYTNLASLSMESGDAVRAEAVLRLASEQAVAPEQSHLNLAKFLMVVQQPEQAVAAAKLAVAKHESAEAYEVLSQAYEATGNATEANAHRAQSQRLQNNSRPLVESVR